MILDSDYRTLAAVSNSTMKDFRKEGPKFYYDNYLDPNRPEPREWSTESTDIGDLVDCLLTQPQAFDKFYYISGDVKVSPDFRKVLDAGWYLVLQFLTTDKGMTHEAALQHIALRDISNPFAITALISAARNVDTVDKDGKPSKGYRNNYGDEALEKYIKTEGSAYYSDLGVANGRKILDMTTYNVAVKCKQSILTHDTIGKLFDLPVSKTERLYGQLMVTHEVNGVLCKILLDYTKFDDKNKIIWPKDVKSARSHKQFMLNYVAYDYANQGSFYSGILKQAYPEYTIAPFEFIVGCTDSGEDPMIYRMSEAELTIARDGAQLKTGKTVQGWMNTVNAIGWHIKNDLWRYPKEFYDNGYIMLNTYNEDAVSGMPDEAEDIF